MKQKILDLIDARIKYCNKKCNKHNTDESAKTYDRYYYQRRALNDIKRQIQEIEE